MTFRPTEPSPPDQHQPLRLVLVGGGRQGELAPFMDRVASHLARVLAMERRSIPLDGSPSEALAAISAIPADAPQGWLAPLGIDPGLALHHGASWAETLGAWRQPTVLVHPASDLDTGRPAAMTALLRHWQVPLLGLLQWDGPWDPEARRNDGLPWLGCLADAAAEADLRAAAVAAAAAPPQTPQPIRVDRALRQMLHQRLWQLDPG